MPKRVIKPVNDECYHVYNRSAGGLGIFPSNKYYDRFLNLVHFYLYPQSIRFSQYLLLSTRDKATYDKSFLKKPKIVEIYAYALMPNHYHFLLKQKNTDGVQEFTSRIQNGHAKYFNIRNKRHGSLYQGPFRLKLVENDNQFLHLSRYIHLNPTTSNILNIDELLISLRTSLSYYLGKRNTKYELVTTGPIIKLIKSKEKYKNFVLNQVDYQRKLKAIEGLIIE